MKPGADVRSIEVLRAFRTELKQYMEGLHSTLEHLKIQSNRAQDWIEHDRTRYWPREAKRAEDTLIEARNALLRCKMAATEGQKKSCVDEKKAVERWILRQRHAEAQVKAVRGWRHKMRHQTDEFQTRMSRLSNYGENELPKAVAVLDRMIRALEKYTEIATPSAGPPSSSSSVDATTEVTQNSVDNDRELPSTGEAS